MRADELLQVSARAKFKDEENVRLGLFDAEELDNVAVLQGHAGLQVNQAPSCGHVRSSFIANLPLLPIPPTILHRVSHLKVAQNANLLFQVLQQLRTQPAAVNLFNGT